MPAFNRALAASAFFIASSPSILLADDAQSLPPVVVTATRSPVPADQIASSMTVITAADIEQQNKPQVADLLREVPGITVANNGGPGQTTRIFMRGTNSNHVLVLIDGVAVNDPSDPGDAFDFSNLTTDNIERIEILRGPQSTLYGSEAIGGVINILTKEGKGLPSYNGFAEYGRYNTRREGLGASGEVGNTSYSFTASNGHSDGISALDKSFGGFEKDGNNRETFSANLASRLTDNFTLKFNARYNRNDADIDSPGSFTRPADDPNPRNDSRQFNGRIAGDLSLFDGIWTQELGISTLNVNRDQITVYYDALGDELFGRQQELGWRQSVDWVNHIKIMPNNTLTLGTEAYSDHFKTLETSEVNVDNSAFFADDQYAIGNFFANAGMRVDENQAFGEAFTWKLAPGYHISGSGTTLKATYGTSFKAPSLSQLYDPSYGNAALSPEKSKGWDMGFEQELWRNKITFGFTFFRNDIRNLIFNSPFPPYAVINAGKARTEGAENILTLHPFTDWKINASYTYTLSENRADRTQLLRRPRHQVNLGTVYQYSAAGDIGANLLYMSSRRDVNIVYPYNYLDIKSFTSLNISTNYKLTPTVTLYARLENALNKHYEEVYGYGEPGMGLYAGVKTHF